MFELTTGSAVYRERGFTGAVYWQLITGSAGVSPAMSTSIALPCGRDARAPSKDFRVGPSQYRNAVASGRLTITPGTGLTMTRRYRVTVLTESHPLDHYRDSLYGK